MKEKIHPKFNQVTVKCACGNTFVTGSTKGPELHVEVCAKCHPFFTGKQHILDIQGRVDRFNRRYAQVPGAGAPVQRAERASASATAEAAKSR